MKDPKDYIVFPLDVPTLNEAMNLVRILQDEVGLFKVGLQLFISTGPKVVQYIKDSSSAGVFLDLKLHDIPDTVKKGVEAAARLNVTFVTVHTYGGERILRSAVSGGGEKTKVLGVTVLTSSDKESLRDLRFSGESVSDISRLVLHRASLARKAGCAGVICSGLEVAGIKQRFGKDFIAVVPGIRPTWSVISGDDQRRITTPAQAVQNGADYIVVGRPIRTAPDPKEAARRIAEEIRTVL